MEPFQRKGRPGTVSDEAVDALPVLRYEHCTFEEGDLSLGLAFLLLKVRTSSTSRPPPDWVCLSAVSG